MPNESRLTALASAVDDLYIDADDGSCYRDREPSHVLADWDECGRWLTVNDAGSHRYGYVSAAFAEARGLASEFVRDSAAAEYPFAIVDLDTGRVRYAQYSKITFS